MMPSFCFVCVLLFGCDQKRNQPVEESNQVQSSAQVHRCACLPLPLRFKGCMAAMVRLLLWGAGMHRDPTTSATCVSARMHLNHAESSAVSRQSCRCSGAAGLLLFLFSSFYRGARQVCLRHTAASLGAALLCSLPRPDAWCMHRLM